MMWKEFEEIAGYEVSFETYNTVIEPMYNAIPEGITKQEFVKMLDKKAFALPTKTQMLRKMETLAKEIREACGHRSTTKDEEELEAMARAFAKRFYGIEIGRMEDAFVYFTREYEYPVLRRGCTYPVLLVIGKGKYVYERINLIRGAA